MAGRKRIRKSRRGEGSFRKTASGTLEYRFSYKDPMTGKPRRKSFTGIDEMECLDKADRWMDKVERERRGVDAEATIVDILSSKYQMDLAMNHLGEAGYARNMDNLKRLEKGGIGNVPIYDLERQDIDAFLTTITGYSNSVIEKIYRQLRLAFRIALEKEIINVNLMAAHDMRCPKSEKPDRRIRALTIEEQKSFVEQMECDKVPFGRNDYRLQLFIELYSGMRMGEINALRRKVSIPPT